MKIFDVEQLVTTIEKEVLFYVIRNLRNNVLSKTEAEYLAKDFMGILPVVNEADLFYKLYELSKRYIEVKEVYVKYFGLYEEAQTRARVEAIREELHKDGLEKAVVIAKGDGNI